MRRRRRIWAVTVGSDESVVSQFQSVGPIRLRLSRLWFAYEEIQPIRLWWWVRLAAWAVTGVPVALLMGPRLTPAGPVGFEVALFVLGFVQSRRLARPSTGRGWPSVGPENPDAGVREPRRPGPLSGAGAVAVDEPIEGSVPD